MPDRPAPNPLGRRRPAQPKHAPDPPTPPIPLVEQIQRTPRAVTHAEPGKPNPYPHRLSVDVDNDTYRALRLIAAQEGCRLIDVIRAGIAHEIDTRQ